MCGVAELDRRCSEPSSRNKSLATSIGGVGASLESLLLSPGRVEAPEAAKTRGFAHAAVGLEKAATISFHSVIDPRGPVGDELYG